MEQIGLEAVLKDADFQRGIAQMIRSMNQVQGATQQTASRSTASFNQISVGAVALGNVIGNLATAGFGALVNAVESIPRFFTNALQAGRSWADGLEDMQMALGMSAKSASIFETALARFGMGDTGAQSFRYLIQQINTTKTQYSDAADTFRMKSSELGEQLAQVNADTAAQIQQTWDDLAEKRAETESDLADKISGIQEDLATKLSDIAEQRAQNTADLEKSLARLADDTRDRLRAARTVRDRRQVKKEAAQAKQDLIDKYNQEQAALAKQEAREIATANKQIALAEKVAAKQIEAADRAADKQIAAYEKAAQKQAETIGKSLEAAKKSLSDVQVKSPLSQALDKLGLSLAYISDESIPFDTRLGKIMDAFKKMPDGVGKSAIAIQLFGRAGIGWLDFLNFGSAGLEEMRKRAEALGLSFSETDIQAFKDFGFSLNNLGLDIQAISIAIGLHLMPVAQDFVNRLDKFMVENMPKFTAMLDRLALAFSQSGIQGLFDQLGTEINNAFPAVQNAFQYIMETISSVMNVVFIGIQNWYNNGGKATLEAWGNTIGTVLVNGIVSALGTLASQIGPIVQAGAAGVLATADENAAKSQWEMMHPGESWVGSDSWKYYHTHSKASGGWIPTTEPYLLHAGEYVLNRRQAMAFAPMLAGASSNTNYNFSNTWNGNTSMADRGAIEKWAEDAAYRGIRRVVGRK